MKIVPIKHSLSRICANLLILFSLFFFASCTENSFLIAEDPIIGNPRNLIYSDVSGIEFNKVKSGKALVDTYGLPSTFEIVSFRKEDGTLLGQSFITDNVTIKDAIIEEKTFTNDKFIVDASGDTIRSYTALNTWKLGEIQIEKNFLLSEGDYYATIKVETTDTITNEMFSTTFEDAIRFNFSSALPGNLWYSPVFQNLVVGTSESTSIAVFPKKDTEEVSNNFTFALGSDTNKLTIDENTGAISLRSGYTVTQNDTINPIVLLTPKSTGSIASFKGDTFLRILISNAPVEVPKSTVIFYYPHSNSGYTSTDVLNELNLNKIWGEKSGTSGGVIAPAPFAENERSVNLTENYKSYATTFTKDQDEQVYYSYEGDLIMDTQDLSLMSSGVDLKYVFYVNSTNMKIKRTCTGCVTAPSELLVQYALDYNGFNNSTANWVDISTVVSSVSDKGNDFLGIPNMQKTQKEWKRFEYDLNSFAAETNFTLKFVAKTTYNASDTGYDEENKTIPYEKHKGNPGNIYISDVNIRGVEL